MLPVLTMRCIWAGAVMAALVVTSLTVPACGRACSCPSSNAGFTTVTLPPAQLSPVASVSADAPCTARGGGAGQIDVSTDTAGTCGVHVQLMNNNAYSFTVAFQWANESCCGQWVAKAQNFVAELADAGTGAQDLPVVPAGCGSTCTSAGTVQPFADPTSAAAALAGRWRICGNWPGGAPDDVVGVQLDPVSASQSGADGGITWQGGNGNFLVSSSSGPVPRMAFGYLLTWSVELWQTDSGRVLYLDISSGPGQGVGTVTKYSACPMRVDMTQLSNVILVPFES
jgi:hypothetical protein